MGKFKDKDGRRKEDARLSRSDVNEFFTTSPLSERIENEETEAELKGIFNSALCILHSICSKCSFNPKSVETFRMLRTTYFRFYDRISEDGAVSLFPHVNRTDLAHVIEGASIHASVDTFLADFKDSTPCSLRLNEEKESQLAELFSQMSTFHSVSTRFEETFSKRKEGRLLPDEIEYSQVKLWMQRLLDVYPYSGRRPRPRSAQSDPPSPVCFATKQDTAPTGSSSHVEFSNPLMEKLYNTLTSLDVILKRADSFQLVDKEVETFNKAVVSLLSFVSHTKERGSMVKSLFTLHQTVKADMDTYATTGVSEPLKESLNSLKSDLLEIWPSEETGGNERADRR